jgi:hypothetical protein
LFVWFLSYLVPLRQADRFSNKSSQVHISFLPVFPFKPISVTYRLLISCVHLISGNFLCVVPMIPCCFFFFLYLPSLLLLNTYPNSPSTSCTSLCKMTQWKAAQNS